MGDARGGLPGDRAGRADDLRHLPDDPIPPGRDRAEGRDGAAPLGRPVHPGSGRRGEPQRTRRGPPLAGRRASATSCSARRSTSSPGSSTAACSTMWGDTSGSSRLGYGIDLTSGCRSRSRSPATAPSRTSPTGSSTSSPSSRRPSSSRPGTTRSGIAPPAPARSASSRSAGTRDKDVAVRRAHEQFRWFAGGWAVNADLPTTAGFAGATELIRPEDVADSIPCGPDIDTDRQGGQRIRRGRLHRHRRRAGRRREPERLLGLRGERAAARPARHGRLAAAG